MFPSIYRLEHLRCSSQSLQDAAATLTVVEPAPISLYLLVQVVDYLWLFLLRVAAVLPYGAHIAGPSRQKAMRLHISIPESDFSYSNAMRAL